ncbi:DegV family protein [Falsibacillus pallidus]|uniref:DegV family protein with EDD domain n=1 Tax=Falsibacillus pallidus TaxID=493781 RepID=A0A370GWZ1_9BACI|nr:DegV family protein [Falsibacillus pallidus]RDI47796.1 DegV family protein with EDD domain [Falsibacillus pallidus]
MTIKLFADSASDLPLSFYEENDAVLIPLRVEIDSNEYDDLKTINPKQLYTEVKNGKMPKTSQASPQVLQTLFKELAEKKETGIYIAFSSQLSGTYQTAVMVHDQVKEDFPDLDLTIIDSKCASLGYGLVVLEAAKLIQNGAPKDVILNDIQFRCQHMEHLFTVEDLEFLARGGRVSKASAFIGGLLNIKPLLHVEDGKLIPLEKIRGRKKLFKRMVELMLERGQDLENQTIAISHGDDEESALHLKELILEASSVKEVVINMIGAAVGSHSGPGTIALFFYNETKK